MVAVALWQQLLALALAKKVAVLLAARLYGIPRLYRRSQKAVRYLASDHQQRLLWAGRVRGAFRAPEVLVQRCRGWPAADQAAAASTSGLPKVNSQTPGALSFASSPITSKQRIQSYQTGGRLSWQSAAAVVWDGGSYMKERIFGRMQASSVHSPAEAASMRFLRQARQAYNFMPVVLAVPS